MPGNLLAESPGTDRLHYILEHINYWIVSSVSQKRAKAIRSSTALLRFTITFPEFDVFGKFFSEGQRRFFLRTAVLAIHDPLLRVSQAELLLAYSLLGEAQKLLADKQEDVMSKVMRHLRIIWHLRRVPEALQGLCL
ncbi:uncharacterized protein LOC120400640 isoform X5 [Mauremys reevesii]|uniref:uncharacterized protein LOC120400640 isoform X5 n=1 Tax=Mauremys reevesii TaxID=260615 RepID=UPI00193FB943|nr:uncharacterized protein LOC120400640 isoform X5 [Mauremys reevesii]XP_039385423.1 uncharacterized protein LOC120400640 isoform X5 [Mauremys reevesii]